MKDRYFVVPFFAGRHFAATIEVERLKQDSREIRTLAKHLIVEKNRADNSAQAASLGGLQAQQRNDVSRVRMKGLPMRCLINACGGILDAAAEVLDMPQD